MKPLLTPSPTFRPKLAALVGIAVLLACMTAATRYFDTLRSSSAFGVRAGYIGSLTLAEFNAAMLDTETGQRGYVLTRDARYLAPYDEAHRHIDDGLDAIRGRFGDVEAVHRLEEDVGQTLSLLDRGIARATEGDVVGARELLGPARGAMDHVRRDIALLESLEVERRLAADQVRVQAADRAAFVNVASGALVVALLLLLAAGIRSDVQTITQQSELLVAQRGELERRQEELQIASAALTERNTRLAETNAVLAEAIRERAKAYEALERRNRDLDEFASITSHDLKAPLRAISSLASWIEEDLGDAVPANVREHVELLKQRTRRLDLLIDGILLYSRAGRDSAVAKVSLARRVEEARDLLGVARERLVLGGDDLELETDATQLQQVLQNLIGNAVKHGGDATPIEVTWRRDGDYAEVAVRDHGPGIDPRFHERIFEIFQTLDARGPGAGAGDESTGIGLAIVKKIVGAQGGKVWVESVPGDGATFRFTWPVRANASPANASPANASPASASPASASPANASPASASPANASPASATNVASSSR